MDCMRVCGPVVWGRAPRPEAVNLYVAKFARASMSFSAVAAIVAGKASPMCFGRRVRDFVAFHFL